MNFNLIKVIFDGLLGIIKWLSKIFDRCFSVKFSHIYFDRENKTLQFFSKIKNFGPQRKNCKAVHLIYSCKSKREIEWGEILLRPQGKHITIEADGEMELDFDLPLSPIAINNDVNEGFLFPFEWDKGIYYVAVIFYVGKKKYSDIRKISINASIERSDAPEVAYEKLKIEQAHILTEDFLSFIGFYIKLLLKDYTSDFGYNYSKFTRRI